MTDAPTDKKLSETLASIYDWRGWKPAEILNENRVTILRALAFWESANSIEPARPAESHPSAIREAQIDDLLERHQGAMTKVEYDAAAAEIRALIREAVEGEREACAKIAEGDLFEDHYRSWPHWNPGGNLSRERDVTKLAEATAAAVRARGER